MEANLYEIRHIAQNMNTSLQIAGKQKDIKNFMAVSARGNPNIIVAI